EPATDCSLKRRGDQAEVRRLAQARRELLRPYFADENTDAHLILDAVERDVDAHPPSRLPVVARYHQQPPAAGQAEEPLSRRQPSAPPVGRERTAEPWSTEHYGRRLRRQRMQLLGVRFIRLTRAQILAFAARDIGNGGAGQSLVQIN